MGVFTIYRVITSVIIAIITGLFQNYFDNKEEAIKWQVSKTSEDSCCNSSSCCSSEKEEIKEQSSCCSSESSCCDTKSEDGFFKRSFKYAFITLFEDIYFSLFIGLLLGAVFTTFLPKELLA